MIILTPEQRRLAARRMAFIDNRNADNVEADSRELWQFYRDAVDAYVAETNRREQFENAIAWAKQQSP